MIADTVGLQRGGNAIGLLTSGGKPACDDDRDRVRRPAGDRQNAVNRIGDQMWALCCGDLVGQHAGHCLCGIAINRSIAKLPLRCAQAVDLCRRDQIRNGDGPGIANNRVVNADIGLGIVATQAACIDAGDPRIGKGTLEREIDCIAQPVDADIMRVGQEVITVVRVQDRIKCRKDMHHGSIPSDGFGCLQTDNAVHIRDKETKREGAAIGGQAQHFDIVAVWRCGAGAQLGDADIGRCVRCRLQISACDNQHVDVQTACQAAKLDQIGDAILGLDDVDGDVIAGQRGDLIART